VRSLIRNKVMKELFYLNGKVVPKEKAVIFCLDPGFLYGFGVFETIRVDEGRALFLKEHIERLRNNAAVLGMHIERNLVVRIKSLLKKSALKSARIRINVWKGISRSNTLIFIQEFFPYPEEVYEQGFKAVISRFRVNEFSVIPRIKSMNYLPNILARYEAEEKGADEAILLNTRGFIAEGSRSNIFLIKGGRLLTPPLSSGCLPGITRKVVINLARKNGIKILQKDITPDYLFRADEVFITNSLLKIMPITSINNRRINKGGAGRVYKFLADKYGMIK